MECPLPADAPSPRSPWIERALIGGCVAVFLGPVLLDLLFNGIQQAFAYLAADTFYYLVVARNSAELGMLSFDQLHPTNGFHPGWQLLLAALYRLFEGLGTGEPGRILGVLALQAACMSGALLLLGDTLRRARGRVPATFVILPLGAYTLLNAPVAPWYGSWWAYLNGMESGLLLLAFGALLRAMVGPDFFAGGRAGVIAGLLLGAVGVARLDHFLAVPALLLSVAPALWSQRGPHARAWLAGCLVASGALLASVLLFDWLVAGTLLPISGAAKSSFPSPSAAADTLGELGALLATAGDPQQRVALWRHTQLLLPAGVAALLLLRLGLLARRGPLGPWDRALGFGALLTLLLAGYDLCFVPRLEQGHWYFPVSTLLVSLALMTALDDWSPTRRLQSSAWAALPLAAGALVFFAAVHWDSGMNDRHARFFFQEGPLAREHYGNDPPRLVELDDGIIAYATGFPALGGIGYTLDREAAEHHRRGELLQLAHRRGYDRLALWIYSLAPGEFGPGSPSHAIRERMGQSFFLSPEQVEPFDWSVDYQSPTGGFSILRFEPREE